MNSLSEEAFYGLILALGAFLLAMFLTPFYIDIAYKHKWWKKQKWVIEIAGMLKTPISIKRDAFSITMNRLL